MRIPSSVFDDPQTNYQIDERAKFNIDHWPANGNWKLLGIDAEGFHIDPTTAGGVQQAFGRVSKLAIWFQREGEEMALSFCPRFCQTQFPNSWWSCLDVEQSPPDHSKAGEEFRFGLASPQRILAAYKNHIAYQGKDFYVIDEHRAKNYQAWEFTIDLHIDLAYSFHLANNHWVAITYREGPECFEVSYGRKEQLQAKGYLREKWLRKDAYIDWQFESL
ncbi:MAG: hypothetical protein AAFV95_10590 [Bacteroidota bacterium]